MQEAPRKKISAMDFSEFNELVAVALSEGPGARNSQERLLLFLELNHGTIRKKLQGIAGSEMEAAGRLLQGLLEKKIQDDNDLRFLNAMVKVNRQLQLVSAFELDRMVKQMLGGKGAQ